MLSINPRIPWALAFVAGLAMVGLTAWQGYGVWRTLNAKATEVPRTQSGLLEEKNRAPAVPLASLELFGSPQANESDLEENTENLPETNLQLTLRGVLAADGDFPGSALIEDSKRNTDVFLVGDELPGSATLRSVHPKRVILDRGGKLENLYFPEPESPSGMAFSSGADTSRSRPAAASPTSSPATNEQQRREEIRKRLEQLRERLRTNG